MGNCKFRELKAFIFSNAMSQMDETFGKKQKCKNLCFGFVRNLFLSNRRNEHIDYIFYVVFDYFFQTFPQFFVFSMATNQAQKAQYDNVEIIDFADGISSNLRFFDIRSFNKSLRRSSVDRGLKMLKMTKKLGQND